MRTKSVKWTETIQKSWP